MTKNDYNKSLIRQRIAITGETYTTAQKLMRYSKPNWTDTITTETQQNGGGIDAFLAARANQRNQWQARVQALNLSDLITDKQQLQTVTDALTQPGLILIAGQTAGGKTTLQRTLIKHQIKQQNHVAQIDLYPQEIFFQPLPQYYTHYIAEELINSENKTYAVTATNKHAADIQTLARAAETLAFDEFTPTENFRLLNPYLTSHTSLVPTHAGNAMVAYGSTIERAKIAGMNDTLVSNSINLILTATQMRSEIKNSHTNPLIKSVHYTVTPVTEAFKELYNDKNLSLSQAQQIYDAENKTETVESYIEKLLQGGIIKPSTPSDSKWREQPYEVV